VKLISKTYLLIAILIAAAGINLFLFYEDSNSQTTQSYSIIKVTNAAVLAESASASATLIASGDKESEKKLNEEIEEVQKIIRIIKDGGNIDEQSVERIPPVLLDDYNQVVQSWDSYESSVRLVATTTVFDKSAKDAQLYVSEKTPELILLSNQMNDELERLDRDYNKHKQIAQEIVECVQVISEQTFLLSSRNDVNVQNQIKEKKLTIEVGLRKLLQISTVGLDVESIGEEHEDLPPIPRENSVALRSIDPLWEAMLPRINILEERGVFSTGYNDARKNMEEQKELFNIDMNNLLQDWTIEISKQGSEEQVIIQIILVIDIAVFFLVLFIIRKSISPLGTISKAISKVKEGSYGGTIDYEGTDEIGQLVTDFNIMSRTIKEKEEEARKTDVAKDEFLAMITHELKTPLVPIQGYSDILLGEHLGKLTDQQKDRISIIKSSSETLLSIISDLLDAQKLELGQLGMKKQKANIKETIDKSIKTLSPEIEQKNVEIISNTVDLTINHDPERISQVITNLIKNSLTAIESAGKIEIIMENLPAEVKISIKDNGIGIPKDKQKDLFKKFYQVDATLTRERGGSGLGLAICKGIIDNHSGVISVESTPNQGSTFSFTIPKETSEQAKGAINST